jgi:hypothetical protein
LEAAPSAAHHAALFTEFLRPLVPMDNDGNIHPADRYSNNRDIQRLWAEAAGLRANATI